MSKIRIYHNPRCRKSRAGLEYLKSKTDAFEVVEYMTKNPSVKELQDLFMRLGLKPFEMVRTQEDVFRKQFKGKQFTDEEWIRILAEHPRLLRRPIVVKEYRAVWADPPEQMDILFK